MKLSMIVNPFNERNLQLAAQVGVSEIVLTYPGLDAAPFSDAKRLVESFGMKLTHLESESSSFENGSSSPRLGSATR